MSRALAAVAAGLVLAGPIVLAFHSGGFFDTPRLVAGIVACVLVLGAAVAAERPLPARLPGRLAVAGLLGLAAWAAVSLAWAPLGGPAVDDVQRLVLYAAALAAAAAWLRGRRAASATEPVIALGLAAVVAYGLSERLLPGLLDFDASRSAGGRLEQPLTYWNAMGTLAALGLLLATRLAGSPERPLAVRAAAAAMSTPLAVGLYLTFSRGALAALVVGVLVLLALAPNRSQARSIAVAAVAGGLAVALAAVLPEVRRVAGGDGAEAQGAVLLAGLLLLGGAAALGQRELARRELAGSAATGRLPAAGVRAVAAVLLVAAVGAMALAAGSGDAGRGLSGGAEASRFRSLESSRYDYWAVALSSFAENPVTGVGIAGFRAEWERERELPESARDAHSLYLETAVELGVVGIALLGVLMAGMALSAVRAYRLAPAAAAGPIAALAAWAVHAGFDWDWEMPAATLPVLALAGLLIGLSEGGPSQEPIPAGSARGPRASSRLALKRR